MARSLSRPVIWLTGACLLFAFTSISVYVAWTTPLRPSTGSSERKIIEVPERATFRRIAALLERDGIIRSEWAFTLLGRLTSSDRKIIPGEYELSSSMTPREVLAKLLSGQVVLHQVTIPEGLTVVQVAGLLEDKNLVSAEELLTLARDQDFILSTFHVETPTLEGYLFPDTYYFAKGTKAKDILVAMVEGLWRVFTPEWRERAEALQMTVHQVLTLASVIEKETGAQEERELISSVFHNRLRKRIPLQSDPTVIYGITGFDGNLRKRDLQRVTPYNTYRIAGLPPGPIANPGADSIRAALYPAPTTYLYFVSKNNGTHYFSSTLSEHNVAVNKYQREPANTGTSVRRQVE